METCPLCFVPISPLFSWLYHSPPFSLSFISPCPFLIFAVVNISGCQGPWHIAKCEEKLATTLRLSRIFSLCRRQLLPLRSSWLHWEMASVTNWDSGRKCRTDPPQFENLDFSVNFDRFFGRRWYVVARSVHRWRWRRGFSDLGKGRLFRPETQMTGSSYSIETDVNRTEGPCRDFVDTMMMTITVIIIIMAGPMFVNKQSTTQSWIVMRPWSTENSFKFLVCSFVYFSFFFLKKRIEMFPFWKRRKICSVPERRPGTSAIIHSTKFWNGVVKLVNNWPLFHSVSP